MEMQAHNPNMIALYEETDMEVEYDDTVPMDVDDPEEAPMTPFEEEVMSMALDIIQACGRYVSSITLPVERMMNLINANPAL
jgi:hypothetical protein